MFRRLKSSLPKDFEFPQDFEGLGYFINENGQIRMINDPEKPFHYRFSKNERAVEMRKEAMEETIRQTIYSCLAERGLERRNLPAGTPDTEPHIPIYATKDLEQCKTLIVYVGELDKELGVLAGRVINRETIGKGSVLDFIDNIQKSPLLSAKQTGIVLANPGQLFWHRRGGRALSWHSWKAIPRPTAVAPPYALTELNKVSRNETAHAHIICLFEDVVCPVVDANAGCKVFVIGTGDGWLATFEYLQRNWAKWERNMAAFALMNGGYVPQPEFYDKGFFEWWGQKARAYMVSDEQLGTPLLGRSSLGCNVYSGGEAFYEECVLVRAHEAVVDYFKILLQQDSFQNEPQTLDEEAAKKGKDNEEIEKLAEKLAEKLEEKLEPVQLSDNIWEDPEDEDAHSLKALGDKGNPKVIELED